MMKMLISWKEANSKKKANQLSILIEKSNVKSENVTPSTIMK